MRYGLKSFFHKTAQEGSNAAFCQENAIIEFQLYFVSLEQGQNGVCLEDFLLFAICHSNWPDTSLGFNEKNQSVFDWQKFVTSFFDMWWFNTLLIAKRYKKYTWNSFKRKVKFLYNLTRPFSWYNKTLHLRHCTLAIVSCRISWSFLFVFFFLFFWRQYFLVTFYHQLSRFGSRRSSSELKFLCRFEEYVSNIENV